MSAIRTSRLLCLLAASVAAAAPFVTAQDQPQPPFQTEVNYVRVDMYPTMDGRPVTDLVATDVEVLEDGVLQKIAQFEHIAIAGPRSQTTRREPSTVDEMRRAARDPRARVFVLFLDPRSVDLEGSMKIRQPLVKALNALIGGDDLIAVMTPEMSARDITFTRQTGGIEQLLAKYWGIKGWSGTRDLTEIKYGVCFDRPPNEGGNAISDEMVRRRREVRTLDALDDLVRHVGALREERKAVITISDGWPLYGPSRTLSRPVNIKEVVPVPVITADPRTGRPRVGEPSPPVAVSSGGVEDIDRTKCDADRMALAALTNEQRFIRMMQGANRANVSFYPISPSGALSQQPTLNRNRSLDMMAEITDGLAILRPGEMDPRLQRLVDDLSSYYLLGYYSNAKPDDRFHRITVRVNRPGMQVRARSGYLAGKPTAARPVAPKLSDAESAESRNVMQAIGVLGALTRDRPLRVQAATVWTGAGEAAVWVVAEVSRNVSGDDWSKGGLADVRLVDSSGATIAAQEVPLPASAGPISARVLLKPAAPMAPGEYQIQVRATRMGALPASDTVRISPSAAPAGSGVLFNRRSLATGNREAPTADLRFRRGERLTVLLPAPPTGALSARLLDRTGKALAVPVTTALRDEADGSRWRAVELALAPLAPGDYIVESTVGSERTLTAFRVIP